MIPLERRGRPVGVREPIIGRLSLSSLPVDQRNDVVRVLPLGTASESLDGYLAVLTADDVSPPFGGAIVTNCSSDHLESGDVVSIDARGVVRTLYRRNSTSNALFATERCNSRCLMCSQPPRQVDDDWRVAEMLRVIELADRETKELGITGGEPTLLGQGLLRVVSACKERLPRTAVHILSNGRAFKDVDYAEALGRIRHPDLMVGVPVYSDIDHDHDFVVQARGAFNETILGLQNLALAGVPLEIRVVLHQHTFRRLPRLAEFICRNLVFSAHVAFMGLEMIGYAQANAASLWVDPVDYSAQLEEAVLHLATAGMAVSIYNHQLCTLPEALWPFSRKSISDWKTEYDVVCEDCAVRASCGGFFAWNLGPWKSRSIKPLMAK